MITAKLVEQGTLKDASSAFATGVVKLVQGGLVSGAAVGGRPSECSGRGKLAGRMDRG